MFYKTFYPSPIGNLTLGSDGDNLVGLWIEGQKYYEDTVDEEMIHRDDVPVFDETREWLDRYFNGEEPEISALPMAPIGGEFRQAVWKILCDIPYGEVTTYGEIARKIAIFKSIPPPISIIIPCHRVVGTNGSLTGYAGGIDLKIWLLEHEGVDTSRFFVPKKGTAL